jgi:hypothetical protein
MDRRDVMFHSGVGNTTRRLLKVILFMLVKCCLAAIQPKGFWTRLTAQRRQNIKIKGASLRLLLGTGQGVNCIM